MVFVDDSKDVRNNPSTPLTSFGSLRVIFSQSEKMKKADLRENRLSLEGEFAGSARAAATPAFTTADHRREGKEIVREKNSRMNWHSQDSSAKFT